MQDARREDDAITKLGKDKGWSYLRACSSVCILELLDKRNLSVHRQLRSGAQLKTTLRSREGDAVLMSRKEVVGTGKEMVYCWLWHHYAGPPQGRGKLWIYLSHVA